jgi:hypothetical protein
MVKSGSYHIIASRTSIRLDLDQPIFSRCLLNWRRESSASPDRGEPLGGVDVLISSETTKHRLPQPTDERMAERLHHYYGISPYWGT